MKLYVMFDKDNSDDFKSYAWAFKSKKAALAHRRSQQKLKYGARLSLPIEVEFYNIESICLKFNFGR